MTRSPVLTEGMRLKEAQSIILYTIRRALMTK